MGVGCMVDSCRECPQCDADAEQFCSGPCTFTYNGNEQGDDGAHTKVCTRALLHLRYALQGTWNSRHRISCTSGVLAG